MTLGQKRSLGHAGSCYCSFVSCAEMEIKLVKTEIEIVIIHNSCCGKIVSWHGRHSAKCTKRQYFETFESVS